MMRLHSVLQRRHHIPKAERNQAYADHWKMLHHYAGKHYNDWNRQLAKAFYRDWKNDIPNTTACRCAEDYKALERAYGGIVFDSPLEFFLSGWRLHNAVNEKLKKPVFDKREALCTYLPQAIEPSGVALITLALDNHIGVLDLTLPYMEAYADRIGAELIVLTDNQRPEDRMANKWRVGHLAKAFERTLYVDSDVFIKPDSPNILELPAKFGARDERPDYSYRPDWYLSEAAELFGHQGVEHTLEHCINGGVLLLSDDTAELYDEPDFSICPRRWCSDQYWLSYRMETNPDKVVWLDDRWNWGFIRNDWWNGLEDAWFIHFNGSRPIGYRKDLIAQVIAGNYEKNPMQMVDGWRPLHA